MVNAHSNQLVLGFSTGTSSSKTCGIGVTCFFFKIAFITLHHRPGVPGKSAPIGATTSKTPMPWFTSSTAQTVEGWKKVVRTASWEMVVLQLGSVKVLGKQTATPPVTMTEYIHIYNLQTFLLNCFTFWVLNRSPNMNVCKHF